jgi:hypothetical protein
MEFSSAISTQGTLWSNTGIFANGTSAGTQAAGTLVGLDLTQPYALDFQINLTAATNSIKCSGLTILQYG